MPYISIEKVSGKPDATLPIGFWVSGYIHEYPQHQERVVLSNPIESSDRAHYDWFQTSTIVEIVDGMIHTKNSVWKIKYFHKK